ncbi:MAG: DNA mismatch repair protein MutS, partial [Alicyclobacillus sp.]|nr:DNA mismatch repair protein MutS [Alicyclobacillus sp.]
AILLFRMGDFYEMFGDDACKAAPILDIALTTRDKSHADPVPMCGVPYHAADTYLRKLIDQGFSVAICEQLEDPKTAKGLVKRDVVRVVTPGTYLRTDEQSAQFLAAIAVDKQATGVAFVDVSTGEVWCGEYSSAAELQEPLQLWQPRELLLPELVRTQAAWAWLTPWAEAAGVCLTWRRPPRLAQRNPEQRLCAQYGVAHVGALDLDDVPLAAAALAAAIAYVEETQQQLLPHLRQPKRLAQEGYLVVDATARRNLELFETLRGRQRRGSLWGLLDVCCTALGSRRLRRWLERPLLDVAAIMARQNGVAALVANPLLRAQLRSALTHVYDLERLLGKLSFGSANGRDLLQLAQSLQVLPSLQSLLAHGGERELERLAAAVPDLSALAAEITRTLTDQPPHGVREGGLIRAGADAELDRLRALSHEGKSWLADLEQRERTRTGIKSLKIGYNKVFGYYIEVSKANAALVPPEYERRQTLSAAERYTLPELKQREADILTAEERAVAREYELFRGLCERVFASLNEVQQAAEVLAETDALAALAEVSAVHGYVRPLVQKERGLWIRQGRHPVVEAMHPGQFVPNDLVLGEGREMLLITGPNMAGKSTYMRQTALIVLLAHIGCFVPAAEARIGLVDRIFTRIGASDDLGAGQSTFMVEMVELAHILRHATPRSLVLLDEIGRGTSTYDGMSIAEAVMEALQTPGRAPLTLFATHYHELTDKARALPGAANCSVAVEETGEGIVFLHTVVDRPADRSYGIQVARLAGLPEPVIARALALLNAREQAAAAGAQVATTAAGSRDESSAGLPSKACCSVVTPPGPLPAPGLTADATTSEVPPAAWSAILSLLAECAAVDVNQITPLQALNVLHTWVDRVREVLAWAASK